MSDEFVTAGRDGQGVSPAAIDRSAAARRLTEQAAEHLRRNAAFAVSVVLILAIVAGAYALARQWG